MTDNSSVDFKLILFNFGLKDPIKTPISRLSSALVKICHIHNIFQTTIQLKVMLKCWKECSLYTNAAHWISTFWTIHCLSEVIQIPHMIFEICSQCRTNFAPFCNNLRVSKGWGERGCSSLDSLKIALVYIFPSNLSHS